MTRLNQQLRKLCAMMLAVMMTVLPIIPAGLAEEGVVPVETVETVVEAQPVQQEEAQPVQQEEKQPAQQEEEQPAKQEEEKPAQQEEEQPAQQEEEQPAKQEEVTVEPTEEATDEPTVEPTEEATDEPTVEPTEEATDEPTVEPPEEATDEPTVEPTEEATNESTGEPTDEPTIEPTETPEVPEELVGLDELMLLANGDNLSSPVEKITLLDDGDTYTWQVNGDGSAVKFRTNDEAGKYLTIDPANGTVTTKKVTATAAHGTTKDGVETDEDLQLIATSIVSGKEIYCKVTILPTPNTFEFKNKYSVGIKITKNTAVGGRTSETTYSMKKDSDTGEQRYSLTFASGVEPCAESEYKITFSSSTSSVPIYADTGRLKIIDSAEYTSVSTTAKITISLKSPNGSKQLKNSVDLTISDDPAKIELDVTDVTIPVGGKHTLSYTLKNRNGQVVYLDPEAVLLEAQGGDSNPNIDVKGKQIIGTASGITSVTAKLKENEKVYTTCIVKVLAVPTTEELQLKTANGILVWDKETTELVVSEGETLELALSCAPDLEDRYIGAISAVSSDEDKVTVTANTAQRTIVVTGVAATLSSAQPHELPLVTIAVNSDLIADIEETGDKDAHVAKPEIRVRVCPRTTDLELNYSEYRMCSGDTFTLIAKPLPEGASSRFTFDVEDKEIAEVKEISTPTNSDAKCGYFTVTALKEGTTRIKITSTSGLKPTAYCTLTVGPAPTSIVISPSSIILPAGGVWTPKPLLQDAKGQQYSGTFKYKPYGKLEIIEEDGVTKIVAGSEEEETIVVITSAAWPKLSGATLEVKVKPLSEIGVAFEKGIYSVAKGKQLVITPRMNPADACAELEYKLTKVSASSETEPALQMEVAKDKQSVTLTASKNVTGKYTLEVSIVGGDPEEPNHRAQCTVVVGEAPRGIKPVGAYKTIYVGQKTFIEYELNPTDAADTGVYYSIEPYQPSDLRYKNENSVWVQRKAGSAVTDDQSDLKVNGVPPESKSGNYTGTYILGKTTGFVRVEMRTADSAHNSGVRAQWLLEVVNQPHSIDFEQKGEMVLLCGMQGTRKAIVLDEAGAVVNCPVTYESNNEAVTVDENGVVTAATKITTDPTVATITAKTYNGLTVSYVVRVIDAPKAIKLNENSQKMDGEEEIADGTRFYSEIGVDETFVIKPTFDPVLDVIPSPLNYEVVNAEKLKNTKQNGSEFSVTGNAVGISFVRVTAPNGTMADMRFNVLRKPSRIAFDKTAADVAQGEEKYPLSVNVYDADNKIVDEDASTTRTAVKYTVSNSAIAEIKTDDEGKTYYLNVDKNAKVGATFTVTAQSLCAGVRAVTCKFTVREAPKNIYINQVYPIAREKIQSLNLVAASGNDGKVAKVCVAFEPSNAASFVDYLKEVKGEITFTNDEDSLEYNKKACLYVYKDVINGKTVLCMQPVNGEEGKVEFTFAASTFFATKLTVNVLPAATDGDVEPFEPVTLAVGMKHQIVPKLKEGVGADFTFISSDASRLAVDKTTGLVKALKAGDMPVWVAVCWKDGTGKDCSEKFEFSVVSAPSAIRFSQLDPLYGYAADKPVRENLTGATVNLVVDETCKLGYNFLPAGAMNKAEGMKIAFVNKSQERYLQANFEHNADGTGGVITLKANELCGSAIKLVVSSTVDTMTRVAYINVTIRRKPTNVHINQSNLKLNPGAVATFTASVTPRNAGGTLYYDYLWEDGNEADTNPVLSLDRLTGKLQLKKNIVKRGTIKVFVKSTAVQPSEEDKVYNGRNVCNVDVKRSIGVEHIKARLYYKNTDDDVFPEGKDTEEYLQGKTVVKHMCVGDTFTLSMRLPLPEDVAPGESVTFSKLAGYDVPEDGYGLGSVLNVSAAGTVVATKPGTAVVVVRRRGEVDYNTDYKTGYTVLMKIQVHPSVKGLALPETLTKNGLMLAANGEIYELDEKLIAITPKESAEYAIVQPYSSNPRLLDVKKENGKWVLIANDKNLRGMVTVTFTTANRRVRSLPIRVTVYALPTSIRLSTTKLAIGEGMEQTITASYVGGTSPYGIRMPSSDIATFNEVEDEPMKFTVIGGSVNGEIKKDTLLVESKDARISGVKSAIALTVYPGPKSITVDTTELERAKKNEEGNPVLAVGESGYIYYTVTSPTNKYSDVMTKLEVSDRDGDIGALNWSGIGVVVKKTENSWTYRLRVTGAKPGMATLTVKASNEQKGYTRTIEVKEALNKVSLNVPSNTITLRSDSDPYEFTFSGGDNVYDKYTFMNSNPNVAAVTLDHGTKTVTVTPLKNGVTRITVIAYNGRNASVTIRVADMTNTAKNTLTIAPNNIILNDGEIGKLNCVFNGVGMKNVTFEVTGDDAIELQPDGSGYFTAKNGTEKNLVCKVKASFTDDAGKRYTSINTTTITVRPGPKEATLTTTLTPPDNPVTDITIGLGEVVNFRYQQFQTPTYRYFTRFTFDTSDRDVAIVSSNGVIKGVGLSAKYDGAQATITMRATNGNSASMTVTVKKAPTQLLMSNTLKGMLNSANQVKMAKGTSIELKDNVLFHNTRSDDYACWNMVYASSNPKIVTVDRNTGKMTAVTPGLARITVRTFNNKMLIFNVKVE